MLNELVLKDKKIMFGEKQRLLLKETMEILEMD